jgi:PST family polysaccharide transporter
MTDRKSTEILGAMPATSVQADLLDPEIAAVSPAATTPGADLGARVVKNVAAVLAGRGLAILFSAGASIFLVRFLGAEKLGQFGAIYAYLALFSWLATFGFEPVLVREISRERTNASSLLRTTIVLSVLLSVGTIVIALLVAPKVGYAGYLRTLLALAALEYVLTPVRLPGVIFQVDMRQWYGATINVVRQGFWFAVVCMLWFLKAPLVYVIAGRVVAAVVESLLIWIYSRRFLRQAGVFLRDRAQTIFKHSFPIAFTSLLAMVYLRIDQVMLHKMVNDSILGQYVAATKVSELFELLPAALMLTLAPVLSVSVAEPARFQAYTDRAFRYFMVVAAGLCVFFTTGATLVVRVLYGKQFLPSAPLLAVLIWSEIAVFFSAVVSNVLVARNEQRLLPIPTLVGAAVNVGLNIVLIPRYAASGAAWATLISYSLAWMVCLFFIKPTRSLARQGLRFAIPIVGLALLSVGGASLLPVAEIARVLAACSIFVVGGWMARLIQASDFQYAFRAARGSLGAV